MSLHDMSVFAGGRRVNLNIFSACICYIVASESESERYLFDPYKKLIQSNNEKQLGSGDPY